eukprot:CAMPEP_0195122134 /NCGR_PEP_ID=MMETSP0448-20130528/125792_1 /TAXON_ID=66468 /ORGANISM="Heterocapsa triquestra, Strain CCMP 448" /LENGTH=94 /DNA_ID=CAMNT_0040159619 /DNA_START=31 /DNA_END=312 /DNA_ORIENTATION=+
MNVLRRPWQVVSAEASVQSVWTGIRDSQISSQWLLVCENQETPRENGKEAAASPSTPRSRGVQEVCIRRSDVVGVLSSALSRPEDGWAAQSDMW